jgi:hypothetical protein
LTSIGSRECDESLHLARGPNFEFHARSVWPYLRDGRSRSGDIRERWPRRLRSRVSGRRRRDLGHRRPGNSQHRSSDDGSRQEEHRSHYKGRHDRLPSRPPPIRMQRVADGHRLETPRPTRHRLRRSTCQGHKRCTRQSSHPSLPS